MCGIRFLAKKYIDLINLRIISRFFFFCSSDYLAAPAHYISMIFYCSTCLAILAVTECWRHLDPLCCFSSSVVWFKSAIPLVIHSPSTHLLHLEVAFPISYKEYKTCQLLDLYTEPKDKLSPKLSCSLTFLCKFLLLLCK